MKTIQRAAAALVAALAVTAPALAQTFVHDDAQMLSAATVSQLNTRIGNFNAQTGKSVVVQTVASVPQADVRAAAENAFAQQQVNGVLIFIDKGDRKEWIIPDNALVRSGWWSPQTSTNIANSMNAQFRAGDFNGGVTAGVNGVLDIYRSHLGSLQNNNAAQPSYGNSSSYSRQSSTGGGISMFWWIVIIAVGFLVLRSIMRAASGPRYYGGAPGAPGAGPGPGYGPGYGGGYGWGGGGGGFFSGLLGGLGGAWLGNEMFGRGGIGTGAWGNVDPTAGGGNVAPTDGGGWQSDPGQAGMGGGGGGDWGGGGFGDSGGGFGGGGDFGGGGGDFGGGGGW